jgi:hypothetical protein
MARKRKERKNTGLFDAPDRRHDGAESADNGDSVGVLGGPTRESGLFGGPGSDSGLFDPPERLPGDMPGLFDRLGPATGNESGRSAKPSGRSGKSVGLFDKPSRGGRT